MIKTGRNIVYFFCFLLLASEVGYAQPFLQYFTEKEGLSDGRVTCFLRDKLGYLWIGTENGLNRFDGYKFEVFLPKRNAKHGLQEAFIHDLAEDNEGNIWVATQKGLYVYRQKENHFFSLSTPENPLPNQLVNSICIDNQDRIWIAPNARDLYEYLPREKCFLAYNWKQYVEEKHPEKKAKIFKNIEKIVKKDSQTLLLFSNVGVYSFDTYTQKFSDNSAQSAQSYTDNEGFVWQKSSKGFSMLDPQNQFFSQDLGLSTDVFLPKIQDSEGNLWQANYNSGLEFHAASTGKAFYLHEHQKEFLSTSIMDLYEDKAEGCIWIATDDHGLYKYEKGKQKFTLFRHEELDTVGFPAYMCYQITKDTRGDIWVGTDPGGLTCYNYRTGKFKTLTMEDGLPSDIILGVSCDKKGNIWASTHKGLVKISFPDYKIQVFTEADGLPTHRLEGRLVCLADGSMRIEAAPFPASDVELSPIGIRFHPDSLKKNTIAPRIYLEAFKIFGKEVDSLQNVNFLPLLKLSYQDNFFSFEMRGISMHHPTQTQYAYKLEGYDKDWNYAGTRRYVAYSFVPPGEYRLLVKAFNRDGLVSETIKILPILIVPPFWQTLPFYIALGMAFLLLLYGIYSYQIRKTRREDARKHEEQMLKMSFTQKLAEAEMSALRAQMNPHFIFNAMTSINRFIMKNESEKASDYLNQFSTLIRRILDNSRKKFITLAEEIETLRLYIEIEQWRFSEKFSYHISIDKTLETDFIEIPPMIIQPYVENAIWHGLMHKLGKDRRLSIQVLHRGEVLEIRVEDNGIGRKKAAEIRGQKAHTSHGMSLSEERVALINKMYGIQSQIQILDLVEGTAVVVTLPILLDPA